MMVAIPVSAEMTIPTYTPISRHSSKCPFSKNENKGRADFKCGCRKLISVYDPDGVLQHRSKKSGKILTAFNLKTRTRDWEEAQRIAQTYRDRHDPNVAKAAEAEEKLRTVENRLRAQTVTIEKAVSMFIASKKAERVSPHRIERYLPLLGDVDPEKLTFRVNRRGNTGRLDEWLKTVSPRPVYIADLTPVLVESFRNTWSFDSDLTDHGTFGDLKRFFNYCHGKRWIESHPMAGIKAPKVKRGSRTTAFSDAQYDAILAVIKNRLPSDDAHRLLAFVELMRWGGLALGDAVHFKLSSMDDKGHVVYTRRKTGRTARPRLVPHVVNLLKTAIAIDDDPNRPFYDKNLDPETNANYWSAELKDVFKAAGIETVKTDIRDREPHSHMLRDTFAVGQLREQYEQGQVNHKAIADALGDTVAIFLKHYAPMIEELEQAHRDAQDRIVDAQAAKLAQKQANADSKVMSIGVRK